jgi:hypothetical protein
MEFFYFRVEEFFVYGGDEMAENLVGKKYVRHEGEALHTNSNYLADRKFNLDTSGSTLDFDAAIERAQAREL